MRSSTANPYQISTIKAAELLNSEAYLTGIENFMFDVFCAHNPHVKKSFDKSADPQLFENMFKRQIKIHCL